MIRVQRIALAAFLTFFLMRRWVPPIGSRSARPESREVHAPQWPEVVMLEDHSTPVVGVNIWYQVGSKNEKPGRTGFAHLFEHLMFQGSQHHDDEYFGPIEKLGAQINGSTNTDRTNYYETLPSNGLELALGSNRTGWASSCRP